MNILDFFQIGVYLLFPILLYLSFFVPVKDFVIERNKFYFSLSLFLSFFMLIIYCKHDFNKIIFFSIPIIIAYLLKRKNIALYLSLFLLIYCHNLELKNFILILGELISYFLLFRFLSKKENYKKVFISYFLFLKGIISLIYRNNFLMILESLIFSFIYIKLILKLLSNNELIVDLSLKEKEVKKEIEKERRLKTSIFKLTHELKNPLAVCNGYLEMMDLSNESKTKRYFNILRNEISRSLTIINDFSSFGKIKRIEKEELDVYYLLEEIKDTLKPMFNNRNADIILDDDKEIYFEGDYSRLKQVFVNLLKNALEAKDKENILINIKARELKDKVKITIRDNGCGMTKDELEHIGDVFYTTKENGNGLGLSYCKEIIDLHGGNIFFKSIKDKGTTVTLYFPKLQTNQKSPKTFNSNN